MFDDVEYEYENEYREGDESYYGCDARAEAEQDEYGASFGDPRRCPVHPHVKTSSDDGMFDGPCHLCEAEELAAYEEAQQDEELAALGSNRAELENVKKFQALFEGAFAAPVAPTPDDEIPF